MNVKKMTGAILVLAGIGIALSGPAAATSGSDHKESICHPVNGAGELGNGWNLIPPDKASSHIDESLYPDGHYWKHESNDGRHDVFAVDGQCPGTSTPTETTSTTSVPTTSTSTTSTTSTSSTTTQATTPSSTTIPTHIKEPVKVTPHRHPVVKKPVTVVKKPVAKPTELAFTGPLNMLYAIVGIALVLVGLAVSFGSSRIEVIRNAK